MLKMPNPSIATLEDTSKVLRQKIVAYSHYAKIPHLASCLSVVDILTCLYFQHARVNGKTPHDPDRDRIVLSKGHGAPALFQVLAMAGYFPEDWLFRPDHGGGLFGEHPPTPSHLPGIEAATGSLGHGLPMAVGMALSARIKGQNFHSYAIVGDGECNEGSIWEAAMLTSAQQLSNLTVIVDYNKWQATGRSEEILNLTPLAEKFSAFGFNTFEIDGHCISSIIDALSDNENSTAPKCIIAHTVKGKGVSLMEDDNNWHYRTPNDEELAAAMKELT